MNLRRLILIASLVATCAVAPNQLVVGGDCSITEGPDTVGSGRAAAPGSLGCRPDQDGNADSDVAYDPQEGWPMVVCSRSAGSDRDIAFDEWRNDGWLPEPLFLTSSTLDELDPRVHVDAAGDVYVVWWENAEPQSVVMTRRPAGSQQWERPLLVTQPGRRPSVAAWNETVGVAFERDSSAGGQELVVATQGLLGFSFEVVVATLQAEPLDARLQAAGGRVWVDWVSATGDRVVSELRGGKWTSPRPTTWISTSAEN